jgi:thiamine biosynthesis lipoprotein
MVRVEHVMGTVVSLDLRDDGVPTNVIDATLAWFHEVDDRFSTYKEESEVSRISSGDIDVAAASADLVDVLNICDRVKAESRGCFDAWRPRDGRNQLDPSAVVKGWSVDRAASMLMQGGAHDFCLNAGGDVVARGHPEPGRNWRVGIRHPVHADKVVAVVTATECAVATSGTYERGPHIVDPRSTNPPEEFQSMTVVGPRLAFADAYSTAAFVMGMEAMDWFASLPGYEAYAVTKDGQTLHTPGFIGAVGQAQSER